MARPARAVQLAILALVAGALAPLAVLTVITGQRVWRRSFRLARQYQAKYRALIDRWL